MHRFSKLAQPMQEGNSLFMCLFISFEKCNINQVNNEKNSPPEVACAFEDTDTITFLLKDQRLTTLNSKNLDGKTPLMMALDLRKSKIGGSDDRGQGCESSYS